MIINILIAIAILTFAGGIGYIIKKIAEPSEREIEYSVIIQGMLELLKDEDWDPHALAELIPTHKFAEARYLATNSFFCSDNNAKEAEAFFWLLQRKVQSSIGSSLMSPNRKRAILKLCEFADRWYIRTHKHYGRKITLKEWAQKELI